MTDPIMAETLQLRGELAAARRSIAARDRQLETAYAGLTALQILIQQLDADVHLIQHRLSSALVEITAP